MAPAIIVVSNRRVLVARNGRGWHLSVPLEGRRFTCAAADPHRPGRAYCGTVRDGLWRSDDGGATWEQVGDGPGSGHITALAVDPHRQTAGTGTVYLGTEPSRFFRSEDGGRRWEERPALTALPSSKEWSFPPRPHTHHVRWIEPDPVIPDRIFVAIEAGALVRTLNGGRTWEDRAPDGPFDTHTLASHALAPGRLYCAAGDGYYESADGGASWTSDERGLRHHYLVGVGVDPGDPSTVVVSGSSGPWTAYDPETAESFVYRKTGGGPWQRVRDGLPDPDGSTVFHFAGTGRAGRLYAACNRGIFVSHDGGGRWASMDVPWDPRYAADGVQALLVLDEA